MLASWNESARSAAGVSLGLDYLFLCLYSTVFAFGCLWARGPLGTKWPRVAGLAAAVAWAQWLAATCDGVENYFLIRMLLAGPHNDWARFAAVAATIKFGVLAVGFAYVVAGAVVAWRRRGAATSEV